MKKYLFTIQPGELSLTSQTHKVVGVLLNLQSGLNYSLLCTIDHRENTIKVLVRNEDRVEWTVEIEPEANSTLIEIVEKNGDIIISPPMETSKPTIGTLEEYSLQAEKTRVYKKEYSVIYPALKLTGEAGEVSEKVGKHLRDNDGDFTNPEFRKAMKKELGDVLWYINAMAQDLGMTLQEIAEGNIEKLSQRKEKGTLHGSGDNR